MNTIALLVIFLVGLIPGLYLVAQNGSLGSLRNRTRQAWGKVDTALHRRLDLIPRLVEIARGQATQEPGILDRVIVAREQCLANRGPVSAQAASERELVAGLQDLLAGLEAAAELKASASWQSLRGEWVDVERSIQGESAAFNTLVRAYRSKCESFPSSIVAKMFGFSPISTFEVESVVE